MALTADFWHRWPQLAAAREQGEASLARLGHELRFVEAMLQARPDAVPNGRELLEQALAKAAAGLSGAAPAAELVAKVEQILAPFGALAKTYTVHCVGHAHIDMNWQWSWPETVDICHDTFTTVNRLMQEFPSFRFSQSQASTYAAMEQHSPAVFEQIKQRVAAGQWEVTANLWVEGDKNLASGEALCRQVLYAKRYCHERFGLPYENMLLAFEPDTFGHAQTVPQILKHAGIRYYYFCRAGKEHQLFWWEAPDGSRVLAWNDSKLWYLGPVKPEHATEVLRHEQATGMKDYLLVYGVGDHGGGPTRQDLRLIESMDTWPIWPRYRFSTLAEYFALAEKVGDRLPVVRDELNFVFRGCYTSQSNVKAGNRYGENMMVRAESLAAVAHALGWLEYPREALRSGWINVLFNQFHDILPGSGVRDTYLYAQGLYQEAKTRAGMAWKRAAEQLAARLPRRDGMQTLAVFNPLPWARTAGVTARVFDMPRSTQAVELVDGAGNAVTAQVTATGAYWGHEYVDVAWTAKDVPGMGYCTYYLRQPGPAADLLGRAIDPHWLGDRDAARPWPQGQGAWAADDGRLQNEFYRVQVEPQSGSIASLVDRRNGRELVPAGERLGLLQVLYEAPHRMSAWEIGPITRTLSMLAGGRMTVIERGPVRAVVRTEHRLGNSSIAVDVVLCAGMPEIEFRLRINWLETGDVQHDAPQLKMAFPLNLQAPEAAFEVPFGSVTRPADGREVPTQNWVALRGTLAADEPYTAAVLNTSKYGCDVSGSTVRMTLLRSSYEPDPYPELGKHEVSLAFVGMPGRAEAGLLTRWGQALNNPLQAFTVYAGGAPQTGALATAAPGAAPELAATGGFLTVGPENVGYGALKLAEESDGVVLRLFETNGMGTTAVITPGWAVTEAVAANALEQEQAERYPVQDGQILVPLRPHEVKTLILR